jgi:hypothetical protein
MSSEPLHQFHAAAGALVAQLWPNALAARLVVDIPDGDRVLQNTLHVPLSIGGDNDLTTSVLIALTRFRAGEWVRAKTLAADVDAEPTGGHFRRVLRQLVKDGRVESNTNLGYRLAPPTDSKGQAEAKRARNEG